MSLRVRHWSFGLLLVAAVLVVYWPALDAGFIWDDDANVTSGCCVSSIVLLVRSGAGTKRQRSNAASGNTDAT